MFTKPVRMFCRAALLAVGLAGVVPAWGQVIYAPVPGSGPPVIFRNRSQYNRYYGQRRPRTNTRRTRTNTTKGATTPKARPFRYVPGGNINPAPVVGDAGRVFVGMGHHAVLALDKATGKTLWSFRPKGDVTASPGVGPDGTVYVTSYDHSVYALDGATGRRKWQFTTGDLLSSTPAVGKNGLVYVGGYDDTLYALDAFGLKKWQFKAGAAVASPVVGPDGTVYVGADRVYALNGATGRVKWDFADDFVGNDTPLLDAKSGTLFVGAHDGSVYALDTATGAKKWQYATGNSIESAPALSPDGTLYVGADKLYALYATSGRVRWTFGSGSHNWSGPAIGADGTVYAGCANGSIYAVNPTTGQPRWGFPTGDPLITAPAVGPDGNVFLASSGAGWVYSLNDHSGRVFWQSQAPASVAAYAGQ